MKKLSFTWILLCIALFPILIGIFHKGFFITDDGNWMVIRLSAFYEALRQGQFPVRFLPRLNNGFGYPVADFLYPLFLYIGSGIHLFHFNFLTTIKILFGISLIGSAIGSFLWLRKQFGTVAGFVGSLAYTLFPYHIWDITKRGSVGEVLAMGIVPFIFWQIDTGSILLSACGVALLILSHNTLALLFLLILALYMIVQKKWYQAILSIGMGLLLSAFFWIPAVYDQQYTVFSNTAVSNVNAYFLSSQLYPLLGSISFIVILLSLFAVYKKTTQTATLFLFIALISITLTTSLSLPLWHLLQLGKFVQFPFRFLSLTALSVGFLSGYIVKQWKKSQIYILASMLLLVVYISSWQFFFPQQYQYYPDSYYSTNQDSTTVQNEYMPVWVKKLPSASQQKITISAGKTENLIDHGSSITFTTHTSMPAHMVLAIVYFPGWSVTIDGKEVSIAVANPTGFITFTSPKGEHSIHVFFTETPIRYVADIISLLSIILLFCMLLFKITRKKDI